MGLRARTYGCRSEELTCASCANFKPRDGYAVCPWIRELQIMRGVRLVDDHVVASHEACDGYVPRLTAVEEETWLVASNLVAG